MTWRKINFGVFLLFVAVMLLITSNIVFAHNSESNQRSTLAYNSSALVQFLQSPRNLQQEVAYSDTADTSDTSSDSSSDTNDYSLLKNVQYNSYYASLNQDLQPGLITQPIWTMQSSGNAVAMLAQVLQSKLSLSKAQTDSVEVILINYQSNLHSSSSSMTSGARGNAMHMADPKATANSRIEALLTNAQKSTWSTIRGDWWKEVDTKLGS